MIFRPGGRKAVRRLRCDAHTTAGGRNPPAQALRGAGHRRRARGEHEP